METLRIAIITETLPRDRLNLQPWRYLGDLARALQDEGHQVRVIASDSGMTEWNRVPVETEADRGVFRTGRGLRSIVSTRRLDGGLVRLTAGFFFSLRGAPPREPLAGRLAGIFLRPIHSGPDLARRFLDPDLAGEALMDRHHAALFLSRLLGTWPRSPAYVDRYLFLWESDRASAVAAGLPAASSSVVRHPFDPAYLARGPPSLGPRLAGELASVPRRIVFSGPPEATRGADDAIRALRFLPATPRVQLVLLLRDPGTQGLALARRASGPHEALTVRGMATREEMQAVYRMSHAAVFPYRFVRTALPLVALEAAAFGLPVVTTRVHPLRELEGRTGLAFAEPRSPRSIARALQDVLEGGDPAERERKNREWIRSTPGWPDVAREVASAFRA